MPFPPRGTRAPGSPRRLLIGVCHLAPLPGAPRYGGALGPVLEGALADARALVEGGADLLVVENFGDVPFHAGPVPPETVAALTRAVAEVAGAVDVGVGVNVLRNDPLAGLAICAATGASFVRVNVHVGARVTDQGVIEGRAADTLRARARLCPDVALLADVGVKHSRPLGPETPLPEEAREAVGRGLADAVILTGGATGRPPRPADVEAVREALGDAPLLVGSGVDEGGAGALLAAADGAIVGTWLKRGGRISAPVDPERVRRLRDALDRLGPRG